MVNAIALALVTGHLIAVDTRPVTDVRVVVHWARGGAFDVVDTLAVARDGGFGTLARNETSDSVVIEAVPMPGSRYFANRVTLPVSRIASDIRILLVPRRWPIDRGRFAGDSVAIDPSAILRRAPGYGSFGRVSRQHVVGWSPEAFPVAVVIRHDVGARVTAADSSAFWSAARDVEAAIGTALFRPTMDTTMRDQVYPVDVEIEPKINSSGVTFVTWDRDGTVFESTVRFRNSLEMRNSGVVQHELLHVLGFGHTAAWTSAMTPRGSILPAITEEDVAYAQLLMRVRALQADPLVVGGFEPPE